MDVFALLFASKYGMAALGSVTLAASMLAGTFWVLAQKSKASPSEGGLRLNKLNGYLKAR